MTRARSGVGPKTSAERFSKRPSARLKKAKLASGAPGVE